MTIWISDRSTITAVNVSAITQSYPATNGHGEPVPAWAMVTYGITFYLTLNGTRSLPADGGRSWRTAPSSSSTWSTRRGRLNVATGSACFRCGTLLDTA